ncbi:MULTISPECIES: metal ABC transporter solute-binding protein, Zn/Mn family [Halomonadaceae]|uniref:metal ABC transporter solute-binding protein, Zn/Mn family n=1 Tax=Halomonadaceae TaxID=28256 RepID=UPI0015994415|nr:MULTISPECIES: zinc ABC transporter substrate-binding protein [Halomonas]QJQ94303.1 zinc ABC transporter solute-binding protein [Halomonas sp. PA5]
MRSWTLTLGALAPLALTVGTATAAQPPLNAVTTIGMIGDVIEKVGGECVAVEAIMGPGVDPHLYQASAGDVNTFQRADVIFYSGYALEGQLGDVLERFGETKPTLAVSPAAIATADLITVQDLYGIDPHVWMDVSLWAQIVPVIAETLGEQRPECAERMVENAEHYAVQLQALHEWVGESIATIPDAQRILVTAHDAFGYYGRAYDIEVAGIQGISTETETGIADIREMAAIVAEREVPAVFVESTINPRTVQAVIDAAAERGQQTEIGGELFSDAMGEAGTAEGTYIGMIHANTRHIVEALGGELPTLPEVIGSWAEQWDLDTGSDG